MRFKQNCNGIFIFILATVLIFYAPSQLTISGLELTFGWSILIWTSILLLTSIIYAYYVKKTIFAAERVVMDAFNNA